MDITLLTQSLRRGRKEEREGERARDERTVVRVLIYSSVQVLMLRLEHFKALHREWSEKKC